MSRRSKVTSFPAVGESEARDSFAERNFDWTLRAAHPHDAGVIDAPGS
jgi:hypothetical protein